MSGINKRKSKKINSKKNADKDDKKIKIQEESAAFETTPIVFSWVTVDFIRKPLAEFYFLIAIFGSMAMIVWGLYNRNFIMVVTFIMMAVVIILVLNEEPKKINVKISENGIDFNDEHYNYNDFKSFKISQEDSMSILTLRLRKSFSQFRTIYLENESINDIESFLGIYLERDENVTEE